MNKRVLSRIVIMLNISSICAGLTNATFAAGDYLSPTTMVSDSEGETLYIAEATAKQVAIFDIETTKVTETIDVPSEPTGLALTRDGTHLYVTCAGPKGNVCLIDTRNAKLLRTIPVGHTPTAPLLTPDEKYLYVCNRFDNDISVIRTEDGTLAKKIPALREPVATAVTPDGEWLYVGNHLPAGPASADSVACNISIFNARTMAFDIDIALPNGSTDLQRLVVSPDGRFVFASHILARYTVPTTQLERGWINTNALSIIDVGGKKLLETVLLDDVDYGAANPWALACTSDSKLLCVTHTGTDELSIIEIAKMLEKIQDYHQRHGISTNSFSGGSYSAQATEKVSNIPNELSFLYGIRKRVKLLGKGARSLVVLGQKAYIAEYFTDTLTVVDLSDTSRPKTTSIDLGPKHPMTAERRGEMLFNDASLCFQGWQS
ncbi:MAG: YncE family protein, partial [Sedimentisphaerales bacterium]|nr:YncE family protein [Sedimentisphaerales bacterium]